MKQKHRRNLAYSLSFIFIICFFSLIINIVVYNNQLLNFIFAGISYFCFAFMIILVFFVKGEQ